MDPARNALTDIAALLTIDANGGEDTLTIYDINADANRSGTLSNSQLSGFGLASSIDHSDFENLNLNLGAYQDNLTIDSTITGNTAIDTGADADTVKVETYYGNVLITTGAGSDDITLFDGDNTDIAGAGAYLELNGGDEGDNYRINNAAMAVGDSFVDLNDNGVTGIDNLIFTGSNVDDLIQLDTIYQVSEDPDNEFDSDRWIGGAYDYGVHGEGTDHFPLWGDGHLQPGQP